MSAKALSHAVMALGVLAIRVVAGWLERAAARWILAETAPAPSSAGARRAIGTTPIATPGTPGTHARDGARGPGRAWLGSCRGDLEMMNEVRSLIRAEIHEAARELRALKPWSRLPRKQRDELAALHPELRPETRFELRPTKARATLLCTIMAHSRGRVHRRAAHDGLAAQAAELADWLDALDAGRGLPLLDGNIRAAARVILDHRAASPAPDPACVAPIVEHRA